MALAHSIQFCRRRLLQLGEPRGASVGSIRRRKGGGYFPWVAADTSLLSRIQLLELYMSKTLVEVEPSTYVYIANASFAATSGRGIVPPFRRWFLFVHQASSASSPGTCIARHCRDRMSRGIRTPSWVDLITL